MRARERKSFFSRISDHGLHGLAAVDQLAKRVLHDAQVGLFKLVPVPHDTVCAFDPMTASGRALAQYSILGKAVTIGTLQHQRCHSELPQRVLCVTFDGELLRQPPLRHSEVLIEPDHLFFSVSKFDELGTDNVVR
jgi:hypothetical protein